jgi:indolepyruvate ferredoxin oxidoreductase beta subunit
MHSPKNILLAGVGGQGTILAGKILSQWAKIKGMDVKYSEIHGMSQRGGSVITQVRIGEKVYAPVIDIGTAHYILAFEQLEGLRYAHMLSPKGTMIVSTQRLDPSPVLMGVAFYPAGILSRLESEFHAKVIDAPELAQRAGNSRTSNVVLVGALAMVMNGSKEEWEQAVSETVPPKYLDVNLRAFDLGWNSISTHKTDMKDGEERVER